MIYLIKNLTRKHVDLAICQFEKNDIMKGMTSYCSFFDQKCKVVTQVWMILTHMKHLHMDCERIERKPPFCISDLVWKRIGFWRIWNVLQADQLPPLFKLGCSQLLNKIQNANSTFSIYLYGTKAKGKKAFATFRISICQLCSCPSNIIWRIFSVTGVRVTPNSAACFPAKNAQRGWGYPSILPLFSHQKHYIFSTF